MVKFAGFLKRLKKIAGYGANVLSRGDLNIFTFNVNIIMSQLIVF